MISLRHLLYGGAFLVACVACREENLVGSVPKMSDLILFDTSNVVPAVSGAAYTSV